MSWLAPPVRMTRPRGSAAKGEAASRSRTISRISSTRGLMMRVSAARDTDPRRFAFIPTERRHLDHIPLVRSPGQYTAIERLDSLGIVHAGVEAAGDVEGDVAAAERESVGVDEAAVREYRQRGGAGAHVDHRGAEIGLVVGERREARHIGAGDQRLDREMAALDREHQVAHRRHVGGHDVHVDAEARRQHAARIAHAADARRACSRSGANAARRGRRGPNAGCRRRARGRCPCRRCDRSGSSTADVRCSLAIRPDDIETMTDSTWHLALRSARSTA